MANEVINNIIRNAFRPKQRELAKPTSALRRTDFRSDEEYLRAAALERIQLNSPEYKEAYQQVQLELEAARAAAADEAHKARRAELEKSTTLDFDEETQLSEAARRAAEKEFASGKIQHAAITTRATEIGNAMRKKALESKIDGIVLNEAIRAEMGRNSGWLFADGTDDGEGQE